MLGEFNTVGRAEIELIVEELYDGCIITMKTFYPKRAIYIKMMQENKLYKVILLTKNIILGYIFYV